MKKIFTPVFILGLLLPMLFFQSTADSTLIFDAELSFTPTEGKRFHYWMITALIGFETRWGSRNFLGGAINSVYDDIIEGSGGGIVNATVDFTVYEAINISRSLDDPGTYGGPGGVAPGYGAGGVPVEWNEKEPPEWGNIGGIQPLQGSYDPGSPGGGPRGEYESEAFYLTPIFENNIGYTISSSGRMLNITGLETIGDIISPTFTESEYFDPTRSITVRQVFQISHFLILPDYVIHVGESWKAPLWWNVPLIGKPLKIPLTYTLQEIRPLYRFKCAKITFTGLTDIETDVLDENYSRRKESHVEGDIIINGYLYFDVDRGVVVAMKHERAWERGENHNFYSLWRYGSYYYGFVAILNFDRIDLITPLGNVIDPRTEKEHVLQEFVWATDLVME
jgi:hypothetical protein